jgi:hypothetical protein
MALFGKLGYACRLLAHRGTVLSQALPQQHQIMQERWLSVKEIAVHLGVNDGNPEPDADLRDTETEPPKESIDVYFKHEVLPQVSDAWIDTTKTKVGYEIPLNRHFYRYEPPRPLEVIEADIKKLEGDILAMLREVTA